MEKVFILNISITKTILNFQKRIIPGSQILFIGTDISSIPSKSDGFQVKNSSFHFLIQEITHYKHILLVTLRINSYFLFTKINHPLNCNVSASSFFKFGFVNKENFYKIFKSYNCRMIAYNAQ